ncbi:MAG: hypothetical protein PHP54_05475 [Clostridia bacterium]|nr:hypothetical protein [Clostridia bacterium]
MSLEHIDELLKIIEKNNEIVEECNENLEGIQKLYKKVSESDGE